MSIVIARARLPTLHVGICTRLLRWSWSVWACACVRARAYTVHRQLSTDGRTDGRRRKHTSATEQTRPLDSPRSHRMWARVHWPCAAARLVALGRRRPELQWPCRLGVHLCGGRATTAAGTARWRRVGTRVDWGCNRRGLRIMPEPPRRGSLCLAPPLGSGQLRLGSSGPFRHLRSASEAEIFMRTLANSHANARERHA